MELASTFPTALAIASFSPSSEAIVNGSSKQEAVRLQCSVFEEGGPAGRAPSVRMNVVKCAIFFCCGRLHVVPHPRHVPPAIDRVRARIYTYYESSS